MHSEKIRRDRQFGDQRQFLRKRCAHLLRYTMGIAPGSPVPGEIGQMFVRCFAARHRLIRIIIADLTKRKFDLFGEVQSFGQRFRHIPKQTRHFLRRF